MIPFGLLLGAMALAPMLAPQWWRRHYPKVALGLAAITAGACLIGRDFASLGHAAHEYASFIALIGALYLVAAGIRLEVPGGATPLANVLFLLAGAVAANGLGTTGAAMLLIRPWLELNRGRVAPYHAAFFIFLVANVGGCLTPIGDPPLFLGFLQGIPFWWFAQKSWLIWALGTGWLLAIFWVVDCRACRHAQAGIQATAASSGTWRLAGAPNLFFLAVVLGAVFINRPPYLREALMLGAAAGSYFTTKTPVHTANGFNFHPLTEVAVLFAGVFITMIPALAWLNQSAAALLGTDPSPGTFYWGTGGLSAVLDNAPTYLGFLSALIGVSGAGDITPLLAQKPAHVLATGIGAVFFGAATYIGNGPNFMVKAMAEQQGVRMPSFGGFVIKYSLPLLLPGLIVIWWLFFRD